MKILVVEDTEDSRVLLVDQLEVRGYEVESAENGLEALGKVASMNPELIISDILMPKMDGFEFCNKLKSEEQLKQIPFIFYSATYTEQSDQDLALSLGAVRFIVKPEDPDKLLNIIEEVIAENNKQSIAKIESHTSNFVEFEAQHNKIVSRKLDKKIRDLENQKNQLRIITDSMPGLIAEIDTFGCYLYVNKKYEDWLCSSRDEIIGRKVRDVIGNTIFDVLQPYIDKALSGEKSTFKGYLFDSEGSRHYILARHVPNISESGDINSCFSFVNNLTDQKRKEEEKQHLLMQLRHSSKMESLGTLVSGIAHDYSNLLGVILGYTQLLQDLVIDQPESDNLLREITVTGERGLKLTKKLLTFSKLDSDNIEKLNINTVLKENRSMLETALTTRIELIYNLSDDLGLVFLDSSDFDNVILNICINAMHAMDGKGKVVISTKNKDIYSEDARTLQLNEGEYVLMSFSDTGCGIDDTTKERIFEPFYTTKGDKGTGLGLSQVYGFVIRSGGKIDVYSKPGHGSCFTLYFPVISHKIESNTDFLDKVNNESINNEILSLRNNSKDDLSDCSILIMDDEEDNRELYSLNLSKLGCKVLTACNGEDVVELYQQSLKNGNPIDAVILDLFVPGGLNGVEVAKILLSLNPDAKIIISSGYTDAREMDQYQEYGFIGVLEKDFDRNKMKSAILNALNS